jgi:4-hydroxy-tetrahydrodipicolinate synthase
MSATTFAPNGDLDEDAFRAWLRRFGAVGIGVYVGSGGNGEGHALTAADLDRVYRVAVEELKGKVPVHANIPEEHTARQTIAQAKLASDAGIDVIHLYTLEGRHGMKPTERELRTYFDDVLAVVTQPVCIAVNPTISPVPKPAFVADLVKTYPQIVAVRMSHQGDFYLIDLQSKVDRKIGYYSQFETGLLSSMSRGASLFCSDANILPKTYRQFIDVFAKGDFDQIAVVLGHIRSFHAYCAQFGNNARWLKMAMRVLKLPGGEGGPRRPYLMPPKEELDAFAKGLLKLGIPELNELASAAGLKA